MKYEKVWIYYRTAQSNEIALTSQREFLKNYAFKCNMEVKGITVEYGSGLDMNRKG